MLLRTVSVFLLMNTLNVFNLFCLQKRAQQTTIRNCAIVQMEGGGYATAARYYCLLELTAERFLTRAAVSSFREVSTSSGVW